MHKKKVIKAGKGLKDAKKALILLHGRGATAEDILTLAEHLDVDDYALFAPQASNYTWYPYSFLAPPEQNEPWLSSAIDIVSEVVIDIRDAGIASKDIYFAGFSQGACLALEFVTRNAQQWGGVAAFTGGLIGDKLYPEKYSGDFSGTPVFIGTSDPDLHVPVERVYASVDVLRSMNANITAHAYPDMGHTITESEIEKANQLIFN